MGKVFRDRKYDYSRASIWRFYKNRYFRLAPLLYFNLLIAICFFGNANLSPREFLGDVAFITNFTDRGINLVHGRSRTRCSTIFWRRSCFGFSAK